MSERGYIAIARGWFDHAGFADEPFTEREAWHWLLEQAAWKDARKSVGRRVNVSVKRGQCAFAIRFMAERWQWSTSRVRRFLERRADDTQIALQATRDATIITICNYDKFQGERRADDTQIGEQTDEQTGTKKKKQPITNNSEPIGSAADAAPEPVGEEPKAKLFRVGKTALVSWGIAEKRTGALIGQWLKARNDPIGLLAAIQYARDQNVAEPVAYVSSLVHSKDPANGRTADRTPRNGGDLARELAAEVRERELEAGLFRPPDAVRSH